MVDSTTDDKISQVSNDYCVTDFQRPQAESFEQLRSSADLMAQEGFMNVGSRESGSNSYVTVTQLEQMKPYPGVDYLGAGYDIFFGNPAGDGVYMLDPGFRQPVRNMQYSYKWLTRDGKFTTPVGSYSLPKYACTRSEQYSNVDSAASYAEALAIDASISAEGSYAGIAGSFSASGGYNQARNRARESNFYRFDSKS